MESTDKPVKSAKRYDLTPAAALAVRQYLKGQMTSRELGGVLGVSHQQAINYIHTIARQWVAEGKLRFTDEEL